MRRVLILLVLMFSQSLRAAQTVVSFDSLLPNPDMEIHTQSVSDDPVLFVNHYNSTYDSFGGFAFSTMTDTTNGSWLNQYAAAESVSNAYAVAYDNGWDPSPEIDFEIPAAPKSVRINNTTYAALSIRDGNFPARAFTNGDFFVLTLTATDIGGDVLAVTNHYLADFRGGQTFIQTNWSTLDLSWMPPEVVSLVGTLETTDMGDWGANTPTYFAAADLTYAYAGFVSGISATNPSILCWADGVASYAPGTNVDMEWQTPAKALGSAEVRTDGLGSTNSVVSLGDGGQITLTFPAPVTDGPGPDFTVFENAISNNSYSFLELSFVEVSSDGTNFMRFPCHALATEPIPTYPAEYMEPEAYGGFAGKHLQGSGTPFDLRELAGTPGLDTRRVTHLRLVDVLGDGSMTDSFGNPIYDPTPTWGSGGFDLDAVGVLNALIEISTDTNAPTPVLPEFTTVLEYNPTLDPAGWTTNAPAQGTPNGFFRYKLTR